MPELPEVERMRRDLEAALKGKRITKVEAFEDTIVFDGTSHTEFMAHVTGNQVSGSGRHGKHLWLEMVRGPHIVLHAGMTGNVRVKGQAPMKFMDFAVADVWPPRFVKFIITAEDGTEVAFSDARRLGRVRLINNPRTEPPISNLGFDPYTGMISVAEFTERARKRNVAIKALLLDQSFSAGVGNWIADEILYQAKIHPEERITSLTDEELKTIHFQVKDIIQKACDAGADPDKFPEKWLFHTKWGKGTADPRTRSGEKISFVTVGGRTSAFVAGRQKLKPKRSGAGAGSSGRGAARGKRKIDNEREEVTGEVAQERVDARSAEEPAPKPAKKRRGKGGATDNLEADEKDRAGVEVPTAKPARTIRSCRK